MGSHIATCQVNTAKTASTWLNYPNEIERRLSWRNLCWLYTKMV